MSTRKKAVSGIFWTFSDTLILKGAAFLSTLILARLLSPEDYGLNAVVLIFISIGTTIVDSGLANSLIRTKNADDGDYSSVFWLNFILGIFAYGVVYTLAPLISDFFEQPILTPLLRWYCVSFIIAGLSTVQTAILTAQMRFKKLMLCNLPGAIIGPVVGIWMAYLGMGVWSLVGMFLTTQLLQTLALWFSSPWRPGFQMDKSKAKSHVMFGYKLLLSSLLDAAFREIYSFIIGKKYALDTLGYYNRARALNDYPTSILTNIVSKVTYPLLANIQDNKAEISNAYRQILRMSLFISAPVMLGLSAVAYPLIAFLLGEEWLPAVPYFKIICLASMLYPIHSINLNVLKVYGRTDLFLRLEIIKKVLTVVCILVSLPYGIIGLVWSAVAASVLALLVNTYYSKNLIAYSTKQQLLEMLPTLLISAGMYFVMYLVVGYLSSSTLIIQILISFIAGLTFYLGICWAVKADQLMFSIKLFKSYRS